MKNILIATIFCLCLFGVSYGQSDTQPSNDFCPIDKDRGKTECSPPEKPEPPDKPGEKENPEPPEKPEPPQQPDEKGKPTAFVFFKVEKSSVGLADKFGKVAFLVKKQRFENQDKKDASQIL